MSATRENQIEAVHVCRACGAAIEREDVNSESLISGLIACPHCGQESHLNLEIRGPADKRPPARETKLKE
jgi:DNA-directed RNA polymerase subunit RPC12/RpoP